MWIVGYRISEMCKVTDSTKELLKSHTIRSKDMIHKISEYISEEKLDKRIREIAAEISKDYAKKEIRLVCILKGSIFYTCELAKD